MGSATVTGLECGLSEGGDLRQIIAEMLSGSASAGGRTRRLSIMSDAAEGVETFDGQDGMQRLVEAVAQSDHLILGLGGALDPSDDEFASFRDECYRQAKWVSLADIAGQEGVQITVRDPQSIAAFRFPMPRRELTGNHRGVIIVTGPAEVPDHDDPFLEKSFFLAEELLRILGFQPSGRILATGLYTPPIEHNPYLQEQAFELGRRLARGSAVTCK